MAFTPSPMDDCFVGGLPTPFPYAERVGDTSRVQRGAGQSEECGLSLLKIMAAGELAGSTEFLSRLEAIYAERKRLMDQMRNSAIEGIPIAPPDTLGQVSAWADEWQSMPRAIEQHELPDLTVEEQRDLTELVSAASGLIDDVLSFSTYWGLRAWWAVPALLNALFIRGEAGSFDAAFFFTGKPWWHAPRRLVVPLPHRSQAAFERDRDRLLVAEHHDRHLRDGQEVVIERRLRGHELRALQWQIDSAAVAYDWDPDDPPTEAPWGFFAEAGLDLTDEPDLSYDPTRVIEIESEARLGRSLTYREGASASGSSPSSNRSGQPSSSRSRMGQRAAG